MPIWEQREKEPDEWYARFRAYLSLGPQRTVAAAHTFVLHLAQERPLGNVRRWQREAQRFAWKERAAAFDAEHEHKATPDDKRSDERLRMVAELLRQVYGALRQADIPALSKEEVRSLLPTFRLFFHDLLKFHQNATAQLLAGKGIGQGIGQDGEGALPISADDFNAILQDSALVRELHEMAAQIAAEATPPAESRWLPLRDLLSRLYADEASARRIAAQAQLNVERIHFGGSALDRWQAILTEAHHAGAMRRVIEVARKEYGGNEELASALRAFGEV
jgi:hypothetical protein